MTRSPSPKIDHTLIRTHAQEWLGRPAGEFNGDHILKLVRLYGAGVTRRVAPTQPNLEGLPILYGLELLLRVSIISPPQRKRLNIDGGDSIPIGIRGARRQAGNACTLQALPSKHSRLALLLRRQRS